MKISTLFLACLSLLAIVSCSNNSSDNEKGVSMASVQPTTMNTMTLHDFKVEALDGSEFDLASLKGKKVMVVNTASKCGLTPQYEKLEAIYQEFKESDFTIIGFPANNFLSQEPGSNDEIAEFCKLNYGVSFPMMAKISVKGKDIHPVYQFLTEKSKNGFEDSKVKWNFQKYLINEEGKIDKVINPRTKPDDESVISWIKS